MTKFKRLLQLAWLAGAAAAPAQAVVLPAFNAADFVSGQRIDNPYFLYQPGWTRRFVGFEGDTGVRTGEFFQVKDLGPQLTLLGVQTFTELDESFIDGQITEHTLDYYAQDNSATSGIWAKIRSPMSTTPTAI